MTSNLINIESLDKSIQDEGSCSSKEKEEDVTIQYFADDTIGNIAPSQLIIEEEQSVE